MRSLLAKLNPVTIFLVLFLSFPLGASAATPTVTSQTPSATSVSRYAKFESSFQISRSFANTYPESLLPYYYYDPADTRAQYPNRASPYGEDGITINVHFIPPSGAANTKVVPAFYHQQYTRTKNSNGNAIMTSIPNFSWKVRFTPEEVGTYSYYFTVQDKEGQTRYPVSGNLSFTSTASSLPGFVRVSPRNSRLFEYSNGTSFLPIAAGRQWWSGNARSFDYEDSFNLFRQHGINATRIWTQNDGYGLTIEGRYDQYSYPEDFNPVDRGVNIASLPKGTQINQRGAAELDFIVESAEKNSVQLLVSAHSDPYWIWDASIHNESWNSNPVKFGNPQHLNYWKRNYRYRVARWGYSTSVLAWEHWNEHGHIPVGSEVDQFNKGIGEYLGQIDPFRHLRTTSQGSQAYSPAFWAQPYNDMVNYHDYLMSNRYPSFYTDEVYFAYVGGQCLRVQRPSGKCFFGDGTAWPTAAGNTKPVLWSELDTGSSSWDTPNPSYRADHNLLWAGLFSPIASNGFDWYWRSKTYLGTLYKDMSYARQFFNFDYISKNFSYLSTPDVQVSGGTISTTDSSGKLRVLGLLAESKTEAYLWLQNTDSRWTNTTTPAGISATVNLAGLNPGSYQVSFYNTTTGLYSPAQTISLVNSTLSIPVSGLSTDAAVRIASTTLPPQPTSAPQPTAVPAPSSTSAPVPTISPVGGGDIDNNGSVTDADLRSLISGFTVSPPSAGSRLDQYADSQINSFDFSVVRSRLSVPTATPIPPTAALVPTSPPAPTAAVPTPTSALSKPLVIRPSPSPTPFIVANSDEWTQFGYNAQRTNYTPASPPSSWAYKWQWNSANSQGKTQADHLSVPEFVQPITGAGLVYMIANNTVYALNQTDGSVAWTVGNIGSLTSTPAFDPATNSLFVASGNGRLYRISVTPTAGTLQSVSFLADSGLNSAPAIQSGYIYVVSNNGTVYKLSPANLSAAVWSRSIGSPAATTVSVSVAKNTAVVVSRDLRVHALNLDTGAIRWSTKPTTRTYTTADTRYNLTEAENGWPVIAEQHGIVFIRYRLEWESYTTGPGNKGLYPSTSSEIKAYLDSTDPLKTASPATSKNQKALYALNLDTGEPAFTPAVGNGGQGDGGWLSMGPMPVVKFDGSNEYAYIIWRNQLACLNTSWCDSREESTMGEMVLDSTTVSGYTAGDIRFVKFEDIQTDEQIQLTMAGNTIFHNHWLVSAGYNITNRGSGLGATFSSPIQAVPAPHIIWRQVYCTGSNCNPVLYPCDPKTQTCTGITGNSDCPFNATTRYCSRGLFSYGDSRNYPPGFYQYHNDYYLYGNPQVKSQPFTVVSANLVLVKALDGGLMAFKSGNPLSPLAGVSSQSSVLGSRSDRFVDAQASDFNRLTTVAGQIVSVQSHLPKGIYLNLRTSDGRDLMLRIFYRDLDKFDTDPLGWVGRSVTVTGTPSLYWPESDRPEVILTSPDQIQL